MSDENCNSAWPPLPRPGTCNVRVLVQDAAGLTSEVSLPCVDWEAAMREQERIRAALAMPRGEAREAESLAASAAAVDPLAGKQCGACSRNDHADCSGWCFCPQGDCDREQRRLAKTCGHVAYRDHENDCLDTECTHGAYQVVGAAQCECHAETVVGGRVRCLLFAGHVKQDHRYPRGVELTKHKRYTRTAERSEGVTKESPRAPDKPFGTMPLEHLRAGTPRACETCKGKKRVPWPHESTVATMRTGNPATSGTVPCPACTGGR